MALNLRKTVVELLKANAGKLYTTREIAEWLIKNRAEECRKKLKNTRLQTQEDLINQLRAEVGARKDSFEKDGILMTADKPRQYYFPITESDIESTKTKNVYNKQEYLFYPELAKFCKDKKIKTLRISELKAKREERNKNIWLYADVVGFEDITINFEEVTKECISFHKSERSLLYSFEIKDEVIGFDNLRKFFFQTVSNSSWANYSYLVAKGVQDKAMDELQLLCSSFKIGFIKLNPDKPEENDIIIQAPKTELDWKMINRIASVNKDFKKYLKNISLHYKQCNNSDIQSPIWDIED